MLMRLETTGDGEERFEREIEGTRRAKFKEYHGYCGKESSAQRLLKRKMRSE